MTAGVHCAHFEMRTLDEYAMVGVAGPGFDPAAGGGAKDSAEGWVMNTGDGRLWHGGSASEWAGQQRCKVGDVVVRRPPCAAPRRGCAEGLACACRAWCSTSTPAGQTPAEDSLAYFVLGFWFRSLDGGAAVAWPWVPACWNRLGETVKTR